MGFEICAVIRIIFVEFFFGYRYDIDALRLKNFLVVPVKMRVGRYGYGKKVLPRAYNVFGLTGALLCVRIASHTPPVHNAVGNGIVFKIIIIFRIFFETEHISVGTFAAIGFICKVYERI